MLYALDEADANRINIQSEKLQTAVIDEDFPAAADGAERLRATIAGLA